MSGTQFSLPPELAGLRVVLVHDWLTGMRGGEKVLEIFCRLFPEAPVYTLLHLPGSVSPVIESHPIHTSFIQHMPGVASRYRYYLPLFPRAVESLKLPDCDLVLSCSHCVAKGARPPAGALHLSYLLTPMRYIWDMYDQYFGPGRGGLASRIMPLFRGYLRGWDVASCNRVDHFLADSAHVAGRITRHYRRDSHVIHPPVELERFSPVAEVEDYYLVVSALVPYKRVDLAVAACTASGRRLKVVGTGPEEARLRAMAGEGVEFLGWVDDRDLPDLYARARAMLFPGEEDFGITPLESMASGRPVVAFARGGALETLVGPDDPQGRPATGLFFSEQSVPALIQALDRLESGADRFNPRDLTARAALFSPESFASRLIEFIQGVIQ